MTIVDTGFDAEEVANGATYTAYLATVSLPRGKKSPFIDDKKGTAGAYAVRIAGGGHIIEIWGAAFATHDDALRALGIDHALRVLPAGKAMIVRAKGLVGYLERGTGHARIAKLNGGFKTNGESFDAFETFDTIMQALDNDRWTHERITAKKEPHGYFLAEQLAKGRGLAIAVQYQAVHTIVEPNTVLASSDDPDPFGLMSGMAAQ